MIINADNLKITGRLKDLIIRGGENIHPLEVENCLLAHPSILEVSAVGLKDERYGEVVAVFVRKDEDAIVTQDDVRGWVREKLSHHLGTFPTLEDRENMLKITDEGIK